MKRQRVRSEVYRARRFQLKAARRTRRIAKVQRELAAMAMANNCDPERRDEGDEFHPYAFQRANARTGVEDGAGLEMPS